MSAETIVRCDCCHEEVGVRQSDRGYRKVARGLRWFAWFLDKPEPEIICDWCWERVRDLAREASG